MTQNAVSEKIIVAVHGIGDQVRCETIQAVAAQFCRYSGQPASVPLGHFSAKLVRQEFGDPPMAAYMVKTPPDPNLPPGLGFAEVYWADIPRTLAEDRYDLEESKKWARTVVERVRSMDRQRGAATAGRERDYDLAATAITEMVEGVRVLENLLFLAERANLFKFDLRQVLVDYLGDVQVVTEFENLRRQIVQVFLRVMARIHKEHPAAEIYLVAHSEGTVIALLGILDALGNLPDNPPASLPAESDKSPPSPEWVTRLRGLMTIGSPLNKHLCLWPELWDKLTPPAVRRLNQPIQWRNYYDFGDPVGFRLDPFRKWLTDNGWMDKRQPFFTFEEKDDIGFTRYYFPGKAHIDYWTDEGVFGHFIHEVVQPQTNQTNPRVFKEPGTRLSAWIISTLFPFFVALAVLFAGVYLLFKAVHECLAPTGPPLKVGVIAQDVTAVALLLAGITAAFRIPRLTRSWRWCLGGFALFILSLWAFLHLLTDETQKCLGLGLRPLADSPVAAALTGYVAAPPWLGLSHVSSTSVVLACIAIVLVAVGWPLGRFFPSAGAKPLIALGGAIVLSIVLARLSTDYDRFVEGKDMLAHVAKESVRDEGPGAGREPAAPGGVRGASPGRASLQLLTEYTKKTSQAPDFKTFIADADPADVTRKLGLSPDDQTVKVVGNNLRRIKSSPPPPPSNEEAPDKGPLWPVLVAGAAFLYLWWLAAILFDLTVVWHHYIRQSAILDRLQEVSSGLSRPAAGASSATAQTVPPGGG